MQSIRTHWIALYMNGDDVTYFNSFGVEHISKEIKKFIGNKNITTNIYKMQANEYLRIGFIHFMLKVKSFLDYTNLFSLNEYKSNDKVILKYLSLKSKNAKMKKNLYYLR